MSMGTMAMGSMTTTGTGTGTAMTMSMSSPTSTATGMSGMGGMGGMGGMSGGSDCEVSMLWNWNTVGACFISKSWHITSHGMFGGSCIGVICLVICLEFLRRVGREYDAFITRRARLRRQYLYPSAKTATTTTTTTPAAAANSTSDTTVPTKLDTEAQNTYSSPPPPPQRTLDSPSDNIGPIRPTLVEQLVRATLHMFQFAVAYFIMLLAMYFNGYIIICIFIGAFLGAFIFEWEPLGAHGSEIDVTQVTKCCG